MANPFSLEGKSAIVTGASRGLGQAIAVALAEAGANIAGVGMSDDSGTRAKVEALGRRYLSTKADLTTTEPIARIVDESMGAFGRIDILVNNAGTTRFAAHGDLEALSGQDFLDIYAVNVVGAYQMIRACAPSMKAQGFGAVVNISSIAGVRGVGSSVAYAASKGAMNTMTLSLARALAPEIRVNAVCPGFVGTRWFKDRLDEATFAKAVAFQEKSTPLHRAGMPDDIADAVVFFCAEGARHITGETLLTDAGAHLDLASVLPPK